MRTLIIAGLGTLIATAAWAGSFTVTTTPEQDAQIAAALKPPAGLSNAGRLTTTPQQWVQGVVDQRLAAAAQADVNRKLAMLRQACAKKDQDACAKIQAATKGVK